MIYISLEQAIAQGYKFACVDGSEYCIPLDEVKDYMNDFSELAELMDNEPNHLVLDAVSIIMSECENQDVFEGGEQIPQSAIDTFKEACDKFNEAVWGYTMSYQGTEKYIKLKAIPPQKETI